MTVAVRAPASQRGPGQPHGEIDAADSASRSGGRGESAAEEPLVERSESIPLVDVSSLASAPSEARDAADEALHTALRDVGFAYVAHHAVPQELIEVVRQCSREFFELPDTSKHRYALNEWHRGYIAPKTSTIRPDNEFSSSTRVVRTEPVQPNQSESIIFLHELPPDDPDVLAGVPLALSLIHI